SAAEIDQLLTDLIQVLVVGGHLEPVAELPGAYVLQAGVIRWQRGDGQAEPDVTRVTRSAAGDSVVNEYFAELYQVATANLRQLEAREHTAQVPAEVRQEREDRFANASLPILYCSPTMELGVDIKDLNAVNLRNVPPTPANYAQRSGRAGRSGQPALVLAYCTSTSPHDQYYFRRPEQMVAGAVVPPRLDLANEELARAHVHAVWLAETGQSLYSSVSELLDLADPDLPLSAVVRAYIDKAIYQANAEKRCLAIFETLAKDLTPARAPWFSPEWLKQTIQSAPLALDRAANRWRHLYRSARLQQERQNKIVVDPLRSADERKIAQRLRDEAESQTELLTRTRSDVFSDFYSYRYFATEGFLPGYNFPRLPVTAYIPGRQGAKGEDAFLTRARFIAISEFGPRSVLYHEGNRYRVSRVVLPREDGGSRTRSAQFCTTCGYGHFGDRFDVDLCDRCGTLLTGATSRRFDNLLQLESVSTYRVDRISCDEEERLRVGYEIQTVYRFANRDDGSTVTLDVAYESNGARLATATYGPATTLWRVNLGWLRRRNEGLFGFVLDMERGIWEKSDLEPDPSGDEVDPLAAPAQHLRVVPFVEDHRNALVFEPSQPLDPATLLSLQYALKR
ncbi:MAG TPA: helicase-related protein, partial [Chloroflexota bacterium]